MHKLAEETMTQSILYVLTKKFANENGLIQWQSSDPSQSHTVGFSVMQAIKRKANQAGARGLVAAAAAAADDEDDMA